MKTKISFVTESVCQKQWSQQIRKYQNRPAGLIIEDWHRRQVVTKANYHYQLRRVRQIILNCSAEENPNRKRIPAFVKKRAKKIYLATEYTDLRRVIESLAGIIHFQFELELYNRNTLSLFCGKHCNHIKALLWKGDGFLLIYKRLDNSAFNWPRSKAEAVTISKE